MRPVHAHLRGVEAGIPLIGGLKRGWLALVVPVLFLLVIWLVFAVDELGGLDLSRHGIRPRRMEGLRGILTAPLLHGGPMHAFNNSVALLALGWGLFFFYPRVALRVLAFVWVVGGAGVWASALSGNHIGASGVVYGLAAFLFLSGVLRRQRTLMALSLVVVFLYGGLIWGVFPFDPGMSWESHLWGGIAGVVMAVVFRRVPPAVQDPVRKPDLDDEDEEVAPLPAQTHQRTQRPPLRIVYHADPGDEVDDDELAWKRRLTNEGRQPFDPGSTSTTWFEEDDRY